MGAQCDSLAAKVLALNMQGSHWVPVLNPTALLPLQLPACCLGKQLRMAQSLGTLHHHGRPRRSSGLLVLDQHSSGSCSPLGSEASDRRSSSLSLLHSVYLPFQ